MKDILKFVKKHSHKIVSVVIVIFLIILAILVKNFFFPSDNGVYYGTRLDGITKVKVKDEALKKIESSLKERAKSVTARVQGRIIYVDVVVNDDVDIQGAKDLAGKIYEPLTDEQKAYYDIQLMVNNEAKKDEFPIVGYKHHTKEGMSWTK